MAGARQSRTVRIGANVLLAAALAGFCLSARQAQAVPVLPGDVNADSLVDGRDIDGFISAMLAGTGVPMVQAADVDFNGILDQADLDVFVQFLAGTLDPAAFTLEQRQLQLGPVAGLTTTWHVAPASTSVPLGATLQFKLTGVLPTMPVTWAGAVEVERGETFSRAECATGTVGPLSVQAVVNPGPPGESIFNCLLDVVDAPNITCTVDVSVPPLLVDGNSTYYFGGTPIPEVARLRQDGPNHYHTSINQWITFTAQTQPTGFEPLMEWSRDGTVLGLGQTLADHIIASPGSYTFEVGPTAQPEQVQIDTYAVTITSHVSNVTSVPDGQPATFTAVTDPPGYEADITWIASTKYGAVAPVEGSGPSITAQFDDTWGDAPGGAAGLFQWFGVRADNARFFQDQGKKTNPPP